MHQVWVDGVLHPAGQPVVTAFDHGLLTGDGVFETLRVRGSRVFAVRRHLERLTRSATAMDLPLPDVAGLRAAMDKVIDANGLVEGRIRITVTGGPSPLGSERGEHGATTIVAGGPLVAWPPTADVSIVPWSRNEHGALSGVKSTSYGENVIALSYARRRGADEAIFPNTAGRLCEGTGSNVFLVMGGRLLTPPLSAGCLNGVTRTLVIEVAGAEEDDLSIDALSLADEAFLTSTTRDLQPIRSVDGQPLPAVAGEETSRAAAAFAELVATTDDP